MAGAVLNNNLKRDDIEESNQRPRERPLKRNTLTSKKQEKTGK